VPEQGSVTSFVWFLLGRLHPRVVLHYGCCRSSIFPIACGFLQVKVGLVLEPPDQRLEFIMFLAVLLWWILSHAHQVFSEIFLTQLQGSIDFR
jgi:hypothetical protein